MSYAISIQAELLKTKRTASFWLSIIGAAFIPTLFTLAYYFEPRGAVKDLAAAPWTIHFTFGWQAMNSFIFPMYIILICALIPQIEYKNNSWKQVFASPQTTAQVYFSKYITIQMMILSFYVMFNLLMIFSGVLTNLLNDQFTFLSRPIDWEKLLRLNLKTYVSILGISAIQYCLSLRFKNFIAPVGIGLGLIVTSVIALNFHWQHIYKLPFAHPILTLMSMKNPNRPLLENHELNSIGYFAVFLLIGYLDLKFKKEKG
jgi:hypothetical protein